MCIVLDVNSFSNFRNTDDEDMKPVRNWLNRRNGKIVYSPTQKFRNEWEAGGGYELMRGLLQDQSSNPSSTIEMDWEQAVMELQRMGKFKLVPAEDVQAKADALEQTRVLRSDDPHIIALAIIANVKILVVQRFSDTPIGGRARPRGADPALQADFKDRNLVGGKVYITKSHSRLLRKDTCP